MTLARTDTEPLNHEPVHDIRAAGIRSSVPTWYRANKRDLPWRGADAYGVWVSEIMLQQTQVATVIPYYGRFIERFPNIAALASASLDDVLQSWAGLGYYARARNLHRAAGMVMCRHAGRVPDRLDNILKLPGIGDYTAGAILSIAYDQRYSAIDANITRVLCRAYGITGDPKSSASQHQIRRAADRLVPVASPGEFNQALMELGALVCEPADPKCEQCPIMPYCAAGNSPDPTALPEYSAMGPASKLVHSCVVVANAQGEILVIQRSAHGLWGGLWEFPRVVCKPGESPEDGARRAALEVGGVELESISKLTIVKHSVTRFRITLHAFRAALPAGAEQGKNMFDISYKSYTTDGTDKTGGSLRWVAPDSLGNFAFSSPQALVRNALQE